MHQGPEHKDCKSIQGQRGKYILLPPKPLPKGVKGPTAFLGKGAFGTVSIALKEDGTPLAVKTLTLDKSSTEYPNHIAQIHKEIGVMQHLGSNADLIIQESPDSNKVRVYVIQPFIPGIEVEKYFQQLDARAAQLAPNDVEGQLLILKDAMNCWIACLRATQQLHSKGVIHGDLHNGNMRYHESVQEATPIDFGMSHILNDNEEAVYVDDEATLTNYHRAPETRELAPRRAGHPPERKYDKSTDAYSLAIDFGVTSEFTEKYAPDFAGKEIAQIMKLFKELSQEPMLGGNGNPASRLEISEAIMRLIAIRGQLDVRLIQKAIFTIPEQEVKEIAKKHAESNNLAHQILVHRLPVNIKEEIKKMAKQIKTRQLQLSKETQAQTRTPPLLASGAVNKDTPAKRARSKSDEPPSPTLEQSKSFKKGNAGPNA